MNRAEAPERSVIDGREVITIYNRKKKGILRAVFSRTALLVLLMLLQVLIVVSVFWLFEDYTSYFTIAQSAFSVCMILYLFNCGMDATAKLTWLILIMLFPLPATVMLFYTIKDVGHRKATRSILQLIEDGRSIVKQDAETFEKDELVSSGTDDLCRYLCGSGVFPIYSHTETAYFRIGEEKFAAMLRELEKAEKFIFMEYFIVDEGYMWGSILSILERKAKQGVDVRVMYDGMCEVKLLPHDYPERLAQLGIKCKPFTPLTPFISTQYNYRDHRKILVIDGRIAFNGGVNLADEYINRIERFGHWKDAAVMLKGAAVQSFTLMFLQMWNLTEAEPSWNEAEICVPSAVSDGYVMPYGDCPLDSKHAGEMVYIDILYRAKHYVHIMSPYLILDNELETALRYAAERGVDVRIIVPGIPDKKSAYALAKTHYSGLLDSGVKLYEYTPGFVHSKIFVSDDEKAVVGTINLDYRSLYHHFECATYMYRTSVTGAIEADYQETLSKCTEITRDTIKHESLLYKLLGAFLKTIAPLM